MSEDPSDDPRDDIYGWYQRGIELLRGGHPQAAIVALERVVDAEPASRAAREALARAAFDSGDFRKAEEHFAGNLDRDPADDYAAFGVGLCAFRLGDHVRAVEHLAMAVAMRPGNRHYLTALRAARARAR